MNSILCALVQVNTTVGALAANAEKMIQMARKAAGHGTHLIAFPELALSGYPPEDLVVKRHFLRDVEAHLQRMARELPPGCVVIAGAPRLVEGRVYNCAVVFSGGEIKACYRKMILPNYGVFDEKRVFEAGSRPLVLDIGGARLGIHICEDSWYPEGDPCTILASAGLDGLINISASPYNYGKLADRVKVLGAAASRVGAPLMYCNIVGGQDDLVFDGASMILAPAGMTLARARQFDEDIVFLLLPAKPRLADNDGCDFVEIPMVGNSEPPNLQSLETNTVEPVLDESNEVYAALKLGLHDYVEKNRFKKVVVALSGGIDSALVAALAVDALGKDRVMAVTMPSKFSSDETFNDARSLAKNLGIELYIIPIRQLHHLFLAELSAVFSGLQPDATEENIQARIRGTIVMALSNKFGWLVLTTGNKSEMATGYCTLYGDMAGGFAVLKDVPKTMVFALSRWRNKVSKKPAIPASIIERPPTAELRSGQKDSDSLPPYDVLDPILERYVERDMSVEEIVAQGYDVDMVRRVIRLVDGNEYKRRQGAPGIKITPKAFGRDRRMPITNQYSEKTGLIPPAPLRTP